MQMDAQSFPALQPFSYSTQIEVIPKHLSSIHCILQTGNLTGNLICDDTMEHTLRLICPALLRYNFNIIALAFKYGS